MAAQANTVTFQPCPDLKVENVKDKHVENRNFGMSIYSAYCNHTALEFGPEHVWTSILCSFSTFVNKNSESVRNAFVEFEGKRTLTVFISKEDIDNFEMQVDKLNELVAKNVKDPELVNVLIPKFSTSTPKTQFAFSILSLSTVKAYFGYKMSMMCGLPKVTMHGTVEDYKLIVENVKKLLKYDNQQKHLQIWFDALIPVLEKFVESISGKFDLDWWNKCCTYEARGSGASDISGWVSAFCPYDDRSDFQFNPPYTIRRGNTTIKSDYPIIDKDYVPGSSGFIEIDYHSMTDEYMFTRTLTGLLSCKIEKNVTMPQVGTSIGKPFNKNDK